MSTYRKFDKRRASSAFASLADDFMAYTAGDWTISSAGTLSAALSTTEPGGVLEASLTSGASNYAHWRNKAPFTFVRGKKLQAIAEVSSADFAKDVAVYLGFANGAASVALATSSLLVSVKGGKVSSTVNGTLTESAYDTPIVADEKVTLEVYYDGANAIQFFVNGKRAASVTADDGPDDNTVMYLAFGFGAAGEAAATKSADFDYVGAAQER